MNIIISLPDRFNSIIQNNEPFQQTDLSIVDSAVRNGILLNPAAQFQFELVQHYETYFDKYGNITGMRRSTKAIEITEVN